MGVWIFLVASGCFCGGYILSAVLGASAREDMEFENAHLKNRVRELERKLRKSA